MKKNYVSVLVVFMVCLAGSVYAGGKDVAVQELPKLCFVQSVASGSYDGKTLEIKDETQLILYFSDRPNRFVGHMTAKQFLKFWNKGADSFKKDPPNAVLSILSDSKIENAVVELLSKEVEGNIWRYKVKVLSGSIPKSFSAANLFIDEAPAVAMGTIYQTPSNSLATVFSATHPR